MENENNNVTSHCAETYVTKLQNVAPRRKFRAGLSLIPLSTDPDGVRAATGRLRTVPGGSGRLLVGPMASVRERSTTCPPVWVCDTVYFYAYRIKHKVK